MADKRNDELKRIIKEIYPMMSNEVDVDNKRVIIGKGKRTDQCSFKADYMQAFRTLFEYTFIVSETIFVVNGKKKKIFNRSIAVEGAIKYLNNFGITINCTLYCNCERVLLARLINRILNDILSVMCSFDDKFNEKKYDIQIKELKEHYNREIISHGIIPLLYLNVTWNDVERYNMKEDCEECLLIDNGTDWRNFFDICHVNAGIKMQVLSEVNTSHKCDMSYQVAKTNTLNSYPIIIKRDERYIDFLHIDHEFFVPSKFCYCIDYEKNDYSKALKYLRSTYCIDKKRQYMNTLSNISEIISILLRTNYGEFYSDDYSCSKTAFSIGLKQLKYFFDDNNLEYSKEETNSIYKYLITQWLDSFRQDLSRLNLEEMFDMCSNKADDKEYKSSIEESRKKIRKHGTFDVLDEAYNSYKSFYNRNKELIASFERKVSVKNYESNEKSLARQLNKEYDPFAHLKESIELFIKKLDWIVPYYLRITVVNGQVVCRSVDKFLGFGHVGDTQDINIEFDERYTVEGPTSIVLGFDSNIAEIKYILKPEYVQDKPKQDQVKTTNNQDPGTKEVVDLVFKNGCKYRIDFEASGISTAPFSIFIIRRTANNELVILFEKNDIELSTVNKSYSYEFTYNGKNENHCYFSFGYGNIIGGFNIRYLHVSEIE